MKEKISLQGKSAVFNVLMILLNLTGLIFVVIGYHGSEVEQSSTMINIGAIVMALTIGGIILLRGRLMMASVARVLVGGLFIVSGLVKANDPHGFSYKLKEYFQDGALAFRIKEWFGAPSFSLEFLIDYALILSILICIAEIVLGVLTIIGGKIKFVSYSMLLMMLFFTFLTWHSSNCDSTLQFKDRDTYLSSDPVFKLKIAESETNKEIKVISLSKTELVVEEMKTPQCVDDCGCFGDAMKGSVGRSLTPKESYWKDIVLLYLVFWIFIAQWIIKPNSRRQNLAFVSASMGVVVFFSWVFGWYFPIFFGAIVILGALWILRMGGKYLGNYTGSTILVSLICTLLVTYVMMYAPLKDYRAYAIGSDLNEKMNDGIPEEGVNMLVYKQIKTGKTKEYDASSTEYNDSKIWEDKNWKYDTMVRHISVEGKLPSIDSAQFNPYLSASEITKYELELEAVRKQINVEGLRLLDKSNNTMMEIPLTEYNETDYDSMSYSIIDKIQMVNPYLTEVSILKMILNSPKVVIVSSLDLAAANWQNIDRLKEIHKVCEKNKIPFVIICSASREDMNTFREKNKFYVPIFGNDGTELKTISRSNPSMLVLENGVITGKFPFRSTPTKEAFVTKYLD